MSSYLLDDLALQSPGIGLDLDPSKYSELVATKLTWNLKMMVSQRNLLFLLVPVSGEPCWTLGGYVLLFHKRAVKNRQKKHDNDSKQWNSRLPIKGILKPGTEILFPHEYGIGSTLESPKWKSNYFWSQKTNPSQKLKQFLLANSSGKKSMGTPPSTNSILNKAGSLFGGLRGIGGGTWWRKRSPLVGGWTNPFSKICSSNWESSPIWDENFKKIFETTT